MGSPRFQPAITRVALTDSSSLELVGSESAKRRMSVVFVAGSCFGAIASTHSISTKFHSEDKSWIDI